MQAAKKEEYTKKKSEGLEAGLWGAEKMQEKEEKGRCGDGSGQVELEGEGERRSRVK